MSKSATKLPPLDGTYLDQFGSIDKDIYELAQQIWPRAVSISVDLLGDEHLGVELMMKSVARVSATRSSGVEIINPKFYLLRTFKNLVLAEFDKQRSRSQILAKGFSSNDVDQEEEAAIFRRILINELRGQMDKWTKDVFDLLVLGYSFEELAPKYGSASNVIRSKYHKRLTRLTALISSARKNKK